MIIREGVTTADEVSEDGNDFLTTRMCLQGAVGEAQLAQVR